jgi:signal transduction histidine kinase
MIPQTDRQAACTKHDKGLPLYKWHLQGAVVRSGASFGMWLCCLVAYEFNRIHLHNLISDTIAVAYLILMNLPALWILKRIRHRRLAELFGIWINFLEIIGYTTVIYSFGGIEATYLLPIYAALITYVGVMGPRTLPYLIAGFCSIAFGTMIALEHFGVLPSMKINPAYHIAWSDQLAILIVTTVLLFIVAFISSFTAHLLKKSRDRLAGQNQALQLAAHKAQEADRLKSEFLANISHELRTPLNAIIGFSELLKDECLGTINEEQREALRDINVSGNHLMTIINDLLDMSMVEAGKMDLLLTEIDLKALLERSLHTFRTRVREQGLTLSADINDCPEMVTADERKMVQILYKLLSNASKFTPQGGDIHLSAHELWREAGHWVTKRGETAALPAMIGDNGTSHRRILEICVADTGIGLKAEDLERIFNPFEQVDGSLARRHEGTGLGLSLTKRFVELHQGRIWAESGGEQKGSAFHFVIPI